MITSTLHELLSATATDAGRILGGGGGVRRAGTSRNRPKNWVRNNTNVSTFSLKCLFLIVKYNAIPCSTTVNEQKMNFIQRCTRNII
jgi:hypothetical protein